MMLLTNILCLFAGVVLGILTFIRIMDFICEKGLCQVTFLNPKTLDKIICGYIDPERYKD